MAPITRPDIPAGEIAQRIGGAIKPAERLAWTADRLQQLRRVVQNAYLPNASGQRLLGVHNEVVIDAERRERTSTTTLMIEAKADDLRGWSISVDVQPGQTATPEAIFGIKLGRVIPVDEGAELCEFLFEPPLVRGEIRGARHRITYTNGPECTTTGYSLSRPSPLLLLTVRFEGEVPTRVVHTHRPDDTSEATVLAELKPAQLVELALSNPEKGLHTIDWEW